MIIEFLKWLIMGLLGISIGVFITLAISYVSRQEKRNALVIPAIFPPILGRQNEILHLADRIKTGQSSAIIGFFSEERRTILGYLRNEEPNQQKMLYGDKANQLRFSYIDIAFLDKESSPLQFWEMALEPLRMKIAPDSEQLDKAYQACKDNQFNRRSLENLISLISQEGWRLVLLLDKFEALLEYPQFKENWEFFTTLRALAALRNPSPLVLVIASNSSLGEFHKKIQHLSPSASPVLNFIGETAVLGGLSEAEIDNLLDHNDLSLSQTNRQLIKNMAGGHPYLLQKALLAWHEVSLQSKELLEQSVKEAFSLKIEKVVLEDDIKFWPPRTCHAFFTVLQQCDNSDFENELKELEIHGLIAKVNEQWQIRAQIFLKLLANQNKHCKKMLGS